MGVLRDLLNTAGAVRHSVSYSWWPWEAPECDFPSRRPTVPPGAFRRLICQAWGHGDVSAGVPEVILLRLRLTTRTSTTAVPAASVFPTGSGPGPPHDRNASRTRSSLTEEGLGVTLVGLQVLGPLGLRLGEGAYLHPPVPELADGTDGVLPGPPDPVMATTTRVSPPARGPSRACQPPLCLGAGGSGDADVPEDVALGDSSPPELVLLGLGVHADHPLLDLVLVHPLATSHALLQVAAGPDAAEEGHPAMLRFIRTRRNTKMIPAGVRNKRGVSPLSPAWRCENCETPWRARLAYVGCSCLCPRLAARRPGRGGARGLRLRLVEVRPGYSQVSSDLVESSCGQVTVAVPGDDRPPPVGGVYPHFMGPIGLAPESATQGL